ncbi:MAG: M23 family metallopeptidase [Candidatus Sedimenticola sp. (ex Thyasira tokunagai)]
MKIDAPVRGQDKHGSGAFGAPRGSRLHNGVDIACYAGSAVFSVADGEVTKIGYPYSPSNKKKGHLRYVQVTDTASNDARYFYVQPCVKVGDQVSDGQVIGITQGLLKIYPGIIDHFHFEVLRDGKRINPKEYLPYLRG